ncbi:HD domain-containing protein [Amycolatopsis sp. NPDC051128]|uniref:HD domain-containing protein n=1 Tax=Amycolatopsis sp. NPDC051128 TaxID=3155412 RepID=UPI0034267E32
MTMPDPLAAAVSSYLPAEDVRFLEQAYRFAAESHQGQVRKSGDPYITHPVAVATILAEQRCGKDLVGAGLLHDTAGPVPERFGAPIADLVAGLVRLEDSHDIESASDGVLRLKLADRLHNLRTIAHVLPARQRAKSAETLRILVPVAERLDLTDVSRELSALASGVLRRTPRVLAAAAILLPKSVRSRWVAEWTGELAALPTRRGRAGFVAGLTIAMPGLARTLRRTERSGGNYVLSAGAIAATFLNTGLTWPAAVVAVAALAGLAAVLFAGDGTAAKRLRALIEAWRRR